MLSGALSRALCLVNKAQSGSRKSLRPRILVLQVHPLTFTCLLDALNANADDVNVSDHNVFSEQGSPDATDQYIAVMNAIFAAQASMHAHSLQDPIAGQDLPCHHPAGLSEPHTIALLLFSLVTH